MSTRDRIQPSDFHIFDRRLTYETPRSLFGNYLFIPRMTPSILPPPHFSPEISISRVARSRTSRSKMRLRQIQNLLFARGRGTRRAVEMLSAGTTFAITTLGRPKTNHFARPAMLSRNLELCISSKTNRIFACDHANFLYARTSCRVEEVPQHFFEGVLNNWHKYVIISLINKEYL